MKILSNWLLSLTLTLLVISCSAEKQKRLKWNLATTVGEYEKVGHRDPKWDADATEALTFFAQWRAGEANDASLVEKIGNASDKAITAGCKDAFIYYLRARFFVNRKSSSAKEIADAHRRASDTFKQSDYSALRRFYGLLRAAETADKLKPRSKLDCTELMNDAARALTEVIKDDSAPHGEIYSAARAFVWSFSEMDINHDRGWFELEPLLRRKWGLKYKDSLGMSEPVID